MKVDEMTKIIENACKIFNDQQKQTRSVELTFRKAGQDPWYDCRELFEEHLQSLTMLSLYRSAIDNQTGQTITTDHALETEEEPRKDATTATSTRNDKNNTASPTSTTNGPHTTNTDDGNTKGSC